MGLSLNNYNLFVIKKLKISWILSCIQFPLYLTSKIIPKKEIFLYGSMNGYCIADNSKYHYLNNLNKKKFFILNNKKNYNYFKKIGYNVILSKSFKQFFYRSVGLLKYMIYFYYYSLCSNCKLCVQHTNMFCIIIFNNLIY